MKTGYLEHTTAMGKATDCEVYVLFSNWWTRCNLNLRMKLDKLDWTEFKLLLNYVPILDDM